ncbi:nucleoside hydrolase [Myxococcota bacterium]|nr:nucleoside hydrolase [Myxococcota bacterium]
MPLPSVSPMRASKIPILLEMETSDPDDFMTLALLCGHPRAALKGVVVTPGTPHQIGVVRACLARFDLDIPVGAYNLDHLKARGTPGERYVTCVSSWHYRALGEIPPSREAEPGWQVLARCFDEETTLVVGAPMRNLGALLAHRREVGDDRPLGRLFVQGGFAGEGVVPFLDQLPKFRGLRRVPSFNLNGDRPAAEAVIADKSFKDKHFVSKNVCHGVLFDAALLAEAEAVVAPHEGLKIITHGMRAYLQRRPEGKLFHDPLAACCALDPEIGRWAEVSLDHAKAGWGARLSPGSGLRIITGYDRARFLRVLLETSPTAPTSAPAASTPRQC